jgi:flagellar motor protein MotB
MKFRVMLLAPLVLTALMATGCADKTAAQRDSLLKQNQDLQSQLDAEKAARAAAEARANTTPEAPATAPAADATPDMSASGPTMGTPDMSTSSIGAGFKQGYNSHGEQTIEISSDVLFDSGKAALKPSAKKALDKVAVLLKKQHPGAELRIEGYTDPNPVKHSGWDDNWDLGAARARAVLLYLETKGVHNMYIASFGATKLKSGKNLAEDRRVEIVVVK